METAAGAAVGSGVGCMVGAAVGLGVRSAAAVGDGPSVGGSVDIKVGRVDDVNSEESIFVGNSVLIMDKPGKIVGESSHIMVG